MAPSRKELLDLGRAKEGTLSKTPFPVLLQALYLSERTAVLELKQKNLEKHIFLEEGVPVDCESNLLHETPARYLAEKKKITEEQYQKALTESAIAGERIEQTLIRLQFVSPFELFKLLQQNLAFKILDCFCQAWSDAKFKILSEPHVVAQPLRVNLAQLIFTGVSTFSPFSVVEEGAIHLQGKQLALTHEPPHELKSLKLSPKDARLLSELKKHPTLESLCADLKTPPEDVLRKLYALNVLGYVDLEETVAKEKPRATPEIVAPAPVAVVQAPAGPSDAEVEWLKNEVTAAYLKYRTQDPFELLSLEENASGQKIREAFLSWSELFAPWRYVHPDLSSLAEKARDLFTFGARAFAQLADSEQKTLVLKRREAARDARTRRKTTDFSIKTKLLDAKEQHDEGMRRLGTGDARGAISYLEFATDCEPRKAIFRAHLAYARFMADPNGAARQAIAELGEALRIEPECVDAWFLSGEIYRWGNDLDRAADAYGKASKLAPGDRRPVEGLKTIVLARKKQQP